MKNITNILTGQIRKYLLRLYLFINPIKSVNVFSEFLDLNSKRKIYDGAFKGMLYLRKSYGSAYFPKILGTYEKELSPLFTPENLNKYMTFINIGCAEGYYLCGIGYLMKKFYPNNQCKLIGYDIDKEALDEAGRILDINGIEGYKLKEEGFHEDIELIKTPALIICDIEGDEIFILDQKKLPVLEIMDIIVEIHDQVGEDYVLKQIINRFEKSHKIQIIRFEERTLNDFPEINRLRFYNEIKLNLMNEGREKGKTWLFLYALN